MKIKTYPVLERAIEEGIAYGYQRAFKHTETPSEEAIKTEILNSVMNSISEVIDFDSSPSDNPVYLQERQTVL
jgi:hypothetical protein